MISEEKIERRTDGTNRRDDFVVVGAAALPD
jgi:hypothetical protein